MSLFSSSSRQMKRVNADGSVDVYCYACGQYIGPVFVRINRALCEMCRRVENGEPITEEMIQAYRAAKADKVDVSMLLIPPEPDLKALGGKKFSLRSMGGNIVSALGRFVMGQKATPQELSKLPSVQTAKTKRRPRLFANVDLNSELGSMEDIDKSLSKDKNK